MSVPAIELAAGPILALLGVLLIVSRRSLGHYAAYRWNERRADLTSWERGYDLGLLCLGLLPYWRLVVRR